MHDSTGGAVPPPAPPPQGDGAGGEAPPAVFWVPVPPPPPSLALLRLRAILAAVAFAAVTLALMVASPQSAVLLLELLPLPVAFVALRHGWRWALVPATVTVGVALVLLATAGSGVGKPFAVATTALAGLFVLVPLVLAACGIGRRFQRRPFVAAVAAWLAVLAACAAVAAVAYGPSRAAHAARSGVARSYDDQLRECRPGGALAGSAAMCDRLRDQRDTVVGAIDDHVGLVLGIGIALTAFCYGALSLWLLRVFGTRMGMPLHRSEGLAAFQAEWPVAYLLAAGLMLVMAGRGSTTVALVARHTGAGLATLGGLVLLADGLAVAVWAMQRSRAGLGLRIAFWVAFLFLWQLLVPVLFAVATWDIVARPRQRPQPPAAGGPAG